MFSCFRVLFAMITKNLVAVRSPGRNRILHTRHITATPLRSENIQSYIP